MGGDASLLYIYNNIGIKQTEIVMGGDTSLLYIYHDVGVI